MDIVLSTFLSGAGPAVVSISVLAGMVIKLLLAAIATVSVAQWHKIGDTIALTVKQHVVNPRVDRSVGIFCAYAAHRIPDSAEQYDYCARHLAEKFPFLSTADLEHLIGAGMGAIKGTLAGASEQFLLGTAPLSLQHMPGTGVPAGTAIPMQEGKMTELIIPPTATPTFTASPPVQDSPPPAVPETILVGNPPHPVPVAPLTDGASPNIAVPAEAH